MEEQRTIDSTRGRETGGLPALFSLRGRTALITGSSRGIGRAIALALAQAGADVAIHGTSRAAATRTAEEAAAFAVKTLAIERDLEREDAAEAIFALAQTGLGRVDILVLCASLQLPGAWSDASRADTERQLAVNYRSSLELLQRAVPPMAQRGWGRVLTIGSVQERMPNPEMLVYSSLKCAQTAMGLSLAKQYARHGVTVNNLAPGVIATDRYHRRVKTPEHAQRVLAWIPAGRVGEANDCVGAALLLCSDAGRYITGQNLFVDGGMSLGA